MDNNVLVTGSAGFIGFHLCRRLLKNGINVIGIDNINETLTFKTNHNIISGQPLVYDRNNNPPLGIGTVGNDAGTSVVGVGTTTLINAAT